MLRKGGRTREVRNVAFPVVNRNGSDRLVYVYCIASLVERGSPKTNHHGFAEVLFRYRGVASEKDPLWTFFDTVPSKIHVVGESYQLAVVIADRMARYGFFKSETIIATGCLPEHDGTVGVVDEAEFERKLDLLLREAPPGSLFLFPKQNSVESVHDKLQRLKDERGVYCRPIEKLDDVRFLWETGSAIIGAKAAAAAFAALAIAGYITWQWLPEPPHFEHFPVSAEPSDKSINTAGENGAYYSQFCPLLVAMLSDAGWPGYKCTPSRGTLENIERAFRYPTSIGYVQADVYAIEAIRRPDEFKKFKVVRSDLACEGLWMVTKNPTINNFSDILASAQDTMFILPSRESGSAASFAILQRNDPRRLGLVPETNKRYVVDATAVISETAEDGSAIGFFVQFADPENANFKLIAKKNLKVIPVIGWKVFDMRLNGLSIYQQQRFKLTSGVLGWASEVVTACVLVAIITGAPEEAFGGDRDQSNMQEHRIQVIETAPADKLQPPQGSIAAVIRYAATLKEQVSVLLTALMKNVRSMLENLGLRPEHEMF